MSLDVYLTAVRETEVYEANITHNLGKMADAAGLYKPLWRPEEMGITKAGELIGPLTLGLAALKADPDYFKQFKPANGWGTYTGLCMFVESYLAACEANPDATIRVSR